MNINISMIFFGILLLDTAQKCTTRGKRLSCVFDGKSCNEKGVEMRHFVKQKYFNLRRRQSETNIFDVADNIASDTFLRREKRRLKSCYEEKCNRRCNRLRHLGGYCNDLQVCSCIKLKMPQ